MSVVLRDRQGKLDVWMESSRLARSAMKHRAALDLTYLSTACCFTVWIMRGRRDEYIDAMTKSWPR